MTSYLGRRIVLMLPTLVLVSVMVFLIMRLVPGDVVSLMFADLGYAPSLEAMRARLGLDRPLPQQYVAWVADLVRGNLGQSLWTQRTVVSLVAERLPVTLELSLLAIAFGIVYGMATGLVAAVWQDSWIDMVLRGIAVAFLSLPTFWLGTLAIVLPSLFLGWSPSIQLVPLTEDPLGHLAQFALPAVILGTHLGAPLMRMGRAMMLEVLRQDYIRTAFAKGLDGSRVVLVHAVRNALIPVVTILGVQMGTVLAGSVVIESVFSWPGIGSLLFDSVSSRNYPVVLGILVLGSLVVIAANIAVDLVYMWLDPRIEIR